jgi:hypothetical protein
MSAKELIDFEIFHFGKKKRKKRDILRIFHKVLNFFKK